MFEISRIDCIDIQIASVYEVFLSAVVSMYFWQKNDCLQTASVSRLTHLRLFGLFCSYKLEESICYYKDGSSIISVLF